MSESRKLAAILAADVAGYSRLTATDEERTIARLRGLRTDLIDPAISVHHGRVVKRTGDGILIEFRSVVDAVRCSIEVQSGMVERNAGLAPERQIWFRVGIHLGDVIEEQDGDLMGDGVNIAARLENICEPGAICISEPAYWQVKARLDLAVTDLGNKELKNIPEPIRVFSLEVGKRPQAKLVDPQSTPRVPEPPRLSVVVLPFANIGGDPDQEYFVDGVTESLTTDLSRISGSFVIARNTAFTYKGKPIDVKQIGRELNVRYILEGSVQRGGNRLRVNVQLIDAETANHLWAERFDMPIADLFEMQDEIVTRIARTLNVELIAAEARRSQQTPKPDSLDFTFHGLAVLNRGHDLENLKAACNFFDKAIALNPDNVEALVGKSWGHMWTITGFFTDDRAFDLLSSKEAAQKALKLAPNNASAHTVRGLIYGLENYGERGIAEFERALTLDPNEVRAHAAIGATKFTVGHAEDTEAHIAEALRLSPRDPMLVIWYFCIGAAKVYLADDEQAVIWLNRAIDADPNYSNPYFYLAAALAYLDKLAAARDAAKLGLTLNPTFSIRRMRANLPSDHPTYAAQRERAYEGMRRAGVPEE